MLEQQVNDRGDGDIYLSIDIIYRTQLLLVAKIYY